MSLVFGVCSDQRMNQSISLRQHPWIRKSDLDQCLSSTICKYLPLSFSGGSRIPWLGGGRGGGTKSKTFVTIKKKKRWIISPFFLFSIYFIFSSYSPLCFGWGNMPPLPPGLATESVLTPACRGRRASASVKYPHHWMKVV